MLDTGLPVSSSVIAFVTTVHAAMFVIHVQRARGALRVLGALPSAAFATLAWVLTTPAWLAAGVVVHAAWLAVMVGKAGDVARGSFDGKAGALPHASGTASPHALPDGKAGALPHTSVPVGFVRSLVLAVIDETDAIRTFRLARPPGFDFAPGQFLMVKVDVSGNSIARCYSISSSPGASGYLEISVKRQGIVSSALHGTVRAGDSLLIHPPLGRFTMPADGPRDLVLIAGGIGITPFDQHAASHRRHAARAPRHAALLRAGTPRCGLCRRTRVADPAPSASPTRDDGHRRRRVRWLPPRSHRRAIHPQQCSRTSRTRCS